MKYRFVTIIFSSAISVASAADYYSARQEVAQAALPYAELSNMVYGDAKESRGGEWVRYQASGQADDPQTGFYAATYIPSGRAPSRPKR